MPNDSFITLLHALSTWFMVGLIWFVQVVHYPLMARVGEERWIDFELAHTRRATWVVMPAMLVELATAIGLAAAAWGVSVPFVAPGVDRLSGSIGLALVVAIWISTFALQVPCHHRLERNWCEATQRRLVRTNWLRTWLWSVRGALAALILVGQPLLPGGG